MIELILGGTIFLLAGIVVYQQIFFTRQNQQLVDKLMSRSFQEYQTAKNPPPPRVQISNEIPEDLRPLQEFKIM